MTDRELALEKARGLLARINLDWCGGVGLETSPEPIADALLEAGAHELDAMVPRYCRMCANGIPFAPSPNELYWHLATRGSLQSCAATPLRLRVAELRAQIGG